jgi:hypothetical protein
VLTAHPVTLKARNRKPPELGPKVRVEAARLAPPGDDSALLPVINGAGLRDWQRNGLKTHDTNPKNMWLASGSDNLAVEFELPEPVAIEAIEVWNYNDEWATSNGVRKADIAVSADGKTWQTVLRGAQFAEADGSLDYDTPILLRLTNTTVLKARFENMVGWGTAGKVGLSEVVFHQALGPQAAPLHPEDGSSSAATRTPLQWVAGQGATEHHVYFGTAPGKLGSLGATRQPKTDAQDLKPDSTYYWRVDEVQSDGRVVTGRVARFGTAGLVAWWPLDESSGTKAQDGSGHGLTGNVVGNALWAPQQGKLGGAMEFDGVSTFINCGKAPEFDFTDGMTVAAWIKVRKFDKTWQAIVTKGDTAWRLQRQEDTGKVTFSFDSGSRVSSGGGDLVGVVSKQSVDDGKWHHVVGLTDGRRVALYLDGELQATATAKPLAQNTYSVMIGCNAQYYDRRFNGWIDDVRLYGYALSDDEVKALYLAGGMERAAR